MTNKNVPHFDYNFLGILAKNVTTNLNKFIPITHQILTTNSINFSTQKNSKFDRSDCMNFSPQQNPRISPL